MSTNAAGATGQGSAAALGSAAGKAEALCRQGFALHQQGRLDAARELCEQALRLEPRHFNALHLLGVIAGQSREPERAADLIARALLINPQSAAAHNNHGNALRALGRFEAAIESLDRAIGLMPDHAAAHFNRALVLAELDRNEAAVESLNRTIALAPNYAEAHYSRGNILCTLRSYEHALASFDQAIGLNPDHADAYYNRGNVLKELGRPQEALKSFEQALALAPQYAEAHNNRGTVLNLLGRFDEAFAEFERALDLQPDYAEALINQGSLLQRMKRFGEALQRYDRALELKPDYAAAFNNRGTALQELERHEEALRSYERAFALDPKLAWLRGARLFTQLHLCDWSDLRLQRAAVVSGIECAEKVCPPLLALALSDSPALQRQAAQIWTREKYPQRHELARIVKPDRGERIRVGYFSGDYCNHAVSILAAELFEIHDRSRFEVYAFSFGPDTQDEMRVRLEAAFDRFLEVQGQSDRQIAELARNFKIDIAVDLGGFTEGGRPGVFALRAAPVQVSYLGYLGTLGAPTMDYLIADPMIIPAASQEHYAEKILYLPSYQVNDSKRRIAPREFSREELALPAVGFVYCCFNNSYKITPDTFSGWMRILKAVPDSVLWLYAATETVAKNLRREAIAADMDPARLVFGKRLSTPEYLARYRAADLFLDTLPYNAGTTASDALWAGLPVLTCLGEAFAGRVAGSLLQALGLPELITQSPGEYEALAVQLGLNPERLAGIKGKLAANRLTQPLFDTPRFARHLEAAFAQIHARYQADLPPEHVYIEAQQSATPVPVETQDVCTVASHVD